MASKGLRGVGKGMLCPRYRGLLQHRACEALVLAPPCNSGTPMQCQLVTSLAAPRTGREGLR